MSPSPPLALSFLLSRLRACTSASHALQCHALLLTSGHLAASPLRLSNLLLLALASASAVSHADAVFARLLPGPASRDAFPWNTLIRLHAPASPRNALAYFACMRRAAVEPDAYTFPAVLKACACGVLGLPVHAEAVRTGMDGDLFTRNALVSFYCRIGDCRSGRKVFDHGARDLVSWNSMVAGYVACGELELAQELFDGMPLRDAFSWATMIDAYGKRSGGVDRARELFDETPNRDLVCWCSMIDGYARQGRMDEARALFEEMPERNVISWSIVVDGYVRCGEPSEALELFQRMLRCGIKPDRVAAVGAFTACAQLGALEQGRWLHSYLEKKKVLFDVVVQTALIDMYMKCGRLDLGKLIFESMPDKSVVTWNVMIIGLGTHSCGLHAVKLFYQMEAEGAPIDDLSVLAVLTACTHAGLISEGLGIFHRMRKDFGMDPKVEHYGALVDLLGRAGHLDHARHAIETMPMEPTPELWGSLLAACRSHRCVELAELSVERLASLGADDFGVYVLLSNIYADEGMWDGVFRIRRLMSAEGMKKDIGRSVIEVDGQTHEFVNGGSSHSCKDEVHLMLQNLSNMVASI
ncbi:pentatricopeptide repeat-containing protein At3g29230 [Brachypodium distachyon]|uniref:Pentacotripeptide-repeat region of PRORP domain-containing protein n=1 Tax=Brachypodium distachyon TaxID=15368 RepID=I1HUI4_BRADI|nr:pentatricopeptide repeat-containing protein At3g29230 [Brachypodium distachyon]XP_014753626.1 pentatricopeptide repeat-containing protein At3g29230 [Brachypodium distachyon]XP_014753627.1 pentatricopeptide repeat-containing protein At3g29230 [Brachypodium distachyon]XP_014753628.1 pentatricopeptide repeat-containing protein At3g29230 [Brachypodium distachyon]XP_014753629.1 pentatricopeptide repeat-containing protein At3g29230 [Brachypodium distachyon]XP_014753630.1 pentatricopeptide repeat-|eukprot:XP_003564906.1 pentatricopeptide repeat-containing protein At3g29230 [Brachypodium distachyon]